MAFPLSAFAASASGSSYATWYGPGFQGHVMADGQIYNMYNPSTTASNWFPFGTWVRVTNVANGRSVTVRVTDRGNFSWAFDLSYAAFARIASPSTGRIRVRYQVVSGPTAVSRPAPKPAPKPAPAPVKTVAKPATAVATARAQVTSRGGTTASADAMIQAPGDRIYVVQTGDNLTMIAQTYGVSLSALIAANDVPNPNLIYPQQRLTIPPASRTHLVVRGDTLWAIAVSNGTTVQTLVKLNSIANPNLIHPGQVIRLP